MRRLALASRSCASSGKRDTSITLSSMRTASGTSFSSSAMSSVACGVKGFFTNTARLIEPKRQAPYGGNGCSPHGFVAWMVSQ